MTALMYQKARQSHYFIFLMPKKNCNKEFHFFGFTGQLSREEPDGFCSPVTMAVTSRASKLQVFKVRHGRHLNQGLPHESLNIGILTHAGDMGSNPG